MLASSGRSLAFTGSVFLGSCLLVETRVLYFLVGRDGECNRVLVVESIEGVYSKLLYTVDETP